MLQVQKDKLVYLCAESIETPHCFTTRLGGVSQGDLSSMNIGTGRGDSEENVLKNYEILGKALNFDTNKLVLTKQTHTDTVRVVTEKDWGRGLSKAPFSPCDGLITNTPGTALVVFTADCTPIVLWDEKTGAVGAVHAGWRGTAQDIAGKAVAAMQENFGCNPAHIRAAIGPNIGLCCFETDADVPQAMISALGEDAKPFIRARGNKFHVDLKQLNALWLRRSGVSNIEISEHCTACSSELFWSHRVTKGERGSQGAVILCKGGRI